MNPQWRRRRWSLLPTTLLLLHLLPPPSAAVDYGNLYATCNSTTRFRCGKTEYEIYYPFNFVSDTASSPAGCGRPDYNLTCDEEASALMLQTGDGDKRYRVLEFNYPDRSLTIGYPVFYGDPCSSSPPSLWNTTVDPALFDESHGMVGDITLVNCTSFSDSNVENVSCLSSTSGSNRYYLFYTPFPNLYPACEIAHVKMNQTALQYLQSSSIDLLLALREGFTVTWKAGAGACDGCDRREGICTYDGSSKREECVCSDGLCSGAKGKSLTTALAIGLSLGGAFIIAIFIGLLLLYRNRKRKLRSPSILTSRTGSTEPSSAKEDQEFGTFPELSIARYRTQVFTYEELKEATNDFSASNELGDGGFGTVYKGVLRDGRVVAVKQLYQQNYRRLEQFMNEVDILSDLRHPNLVILYGCTSRHSTNLLLVYEYIPNGTVADHLYGALADAGFMEWPIRMSIAIETADALRYLHEDGIQIIHRDVKTNNILLDNNFHVKVADFGLSRLFPLNATHVSTAPQGTPGYVDPEYHQCYQLTDKSDVYSFGVVLAELISSKPAVDITRHRSEINLANMTIKKIQNRQLDQLVDPRLGYQSDSRTREMIDSVAEVAFRCLQLEKDMRPTMKEVLEELRRIRNGVVKAERGASDADAEAKEEAHLLKNPSVHSPISVTERWASVATTPNAST